MKVYVRDRPRSLAVVNDEYCLLLRLASRDLTKCIVEFTRNETFNFDQFREISHLDCYGFLGLISVDNDVFLGAITRKAAIARVRKGEEIQKIYQVDFYSLTRNDWDFKELDSGGYMTVIEGDESSRTLHPCAHIRKLLSNGSFYYSNDFDLSCILQNRPLDLNTEEGVSSGASFSSSTMDESFMWNTYMLGELIRFRSRLPDIERNALDSGGFFTSVIRGFAGTSQFLMGSEKMNLTIISRVSWKRAGTRFLMRGVDDEGDVANFVETETILTSDTSGIVFGFTQVRGSLPFFWEQESTLLNSKITITRSAEAAQPAFDRHFDMLHKRFGAVHIIDLLSDKPQEAELSARYRRHIKAYNHPLGLTHFDFHKEVAQGGYGLAARIIPKVESVMMRMGFYASIGGTNEMEQTGVFRTNCLDCLDRTNMIQQLLSKLALELFAESCSLPLKNTDIWNKHNFLWADNGDALSQSYTNTNALKTSFTRSGKMSLAGAVSDLTKSVSRIYQNNFVDKNRQNTMDILLGRGPNQINVQLHDPINDFVNNELNKRRDEYSSQRYINIFAGTFNLNGVVSGADLNPWLFPKDAAAYPTPDIFLIGFQEIVELTTSQILNADPAKKEDWERRVLACLNSHDDYVLLRSEQLVGTALMLFVKKSEMAFVKGVEGCVRKTGLKGIAGNKGGVAVSFKFAATTFCFITAHLAAGQSNVEDRHHDYKTLSAGLRFLRNRRVKDHDAVIWLGDFNYRITLPNDKVRELIREKDYAKLFEYDQLNKQMERGETFPYYNEFPINFAPTYKFDNGTDIYDTSEKQRVPSWTDRILSRGTNLKQLLYNSAGLMFSDHRPVYAMFQATVIVIDEELKAELSKQLYDRRRAEVGDANELSSLIDLNETTLTHGLPPPSTDSKKWWISGGQSAKVQFNPPPAPGQVINPYLPANPFEIPINTPYFVDKSSLRKPSNGSIQSGSGMYYNPKVPPPPPPRPRSDTTSSDKSVKSNRPPVPRKPVGLQSGTSNNVPALVTTSPAPSNGSLLDEATSDARSVTSWTPLQPTK